MHHRLVVVACDSPVHSSALYGVQQLNELRYKCWEHESTLSDAHVVHVPLLMDLGASQWPC